MLRENGRLLDRNFRVPPACRFAPLEEACKRRCTACHVRRGRPALDVGAVADALAAISQLAWTARERIGEIDVNPLLVLPQGRGVVAVDGLIVLK